MDKKKKKDSGLVAYEKGLIKKHWLESLVLTTFFAILAPTVNPLKLGVAFIAIPNLAPLAQQKAKVTRMVFGSEEKQAQIEKGKDE